MLLIRVKALDFLIEHTLVRLVRLRVSTDSRVRLNSSLGILSFAALTISIEQAIEVYFWLRNAYMCSNTLPRRLRFKKRKIRRLSSETTLSRTQRSSKERNTAVMRLIFHSSTGSHRDLGYMNSPLASVVDDGADYSRWMVTPIFLGIINLAYATSLKKPLWSSLMKTAASLSLTSLK